MQTLTFLHGMHTPRCIGRVDKHFDYYTVQFMVEGSLDLWYDADYRRLEGQWMWPAHPGPHVKFNLAPGCPSWNHRYIAFQGPLVRDWKASGLLLEAPQLPPSEDMAATFDELLLHSKRPEVWGARRATNLLEQILLQLAEARTPQPLNEPWLQIVLENLSRPEAFSPDYNQLAQQCGLGLSTMRRKFKDATGTTLHNYVMQRRVARAKELLAETDMPLKQIAQVLNFSDVYFFASQFRRLAGVAPAAYRKSRQL